MKTFAVLLNDARTKVKEIDVTEVKKKMDGNESFHLVDVREDNER